MSTPDIVIVERHGDVACVVLNRPEKLNALTHEMIGRVRDALAAAQDDPQIKVILLRGQGRAFCAGDDLEDLSAAAAEADKQAELVDVLQDVTRQIIAGPKPVVAVVQGWAIGAAFSWVLNCDLVVCAQSATAFFPELKWGVSPTGAATALAPRLLGVTAARTAFFDFKRFSANDLLELGAVARVVADEDALAVGLECARDLASRPEAALRGVKQLVNQALLPGLDGILANEARLAIVLATGDGVAGRIDNFRQPARV